MNIDRYHHNNKKRKKIFPSINWKLNEVTMSFATTDHPFIPISNQKTELSPFLTNPSLTDIIRLLASGDSGTKSTPCEKTIFIEKLMHFV
jgi:hypothetical protein